MTQIQEKKIKEEVLLKLYEVLDELGFEEPKQITFDVNCYFNNHKVLEITHDRYYKEEKIKNDEI